MPTPSGSSRTATSRGASMERPTTSRSATVRTRAAWSTALPAFASSWTGRPSGSWRRWRTAQRRRTAWPPMELAPWSLPPSWPPCWRASPGRYQASPWPPSRTEARASRHQPSRSHATPPIGGGRSGSGPGAGWPWPNGFSGTGTPAKHPGSGRCCVHRTSRLRPYGSRGMPMPLLLPVPLISTATSVTGGWHGPDQGRAVQLNDVGARRRPSRHHRACGVSTICWRWDSIAYGVVYASWLILRWGGEDLQVAIADAIYLPLGALVVTIALRAARSARRASRVSRLAPLRRRLRGLRPRRPRLVPHRGRPGARRADPVGRRRRLPRLLPAHGPGAAVAAA